MGVADCELDRALDLQRKFGIGQAFADYHELLARSDVDAVSVCTPASTHAGIVLDAIRARKHVLCEKPITTTLPDVAAVIDASVAHPNIVVSCVFQHRNDPALARAHWLLQQGVLGPLHAAHVTVQVHRTQTHYERGRGMRSVSGGGALMEVGIHLLDVLIWLLGDAESASATTQTVVHDIEAEDTAAGWVKLESGLVATFDCATWGPHDLYTFEVCGERTTLTLRYRPAWRDVGSCLLIRARDGRFAGPVARRAADLPLTVREAPIWRCLLLRARRAAVGCPDNCATDHRSDGSSTA